jgi:hypothetical protein
VLSYSPDRSRVSHQWTRKRHGSPTFGLRLEKPRVRAIRSSVSGQTSRAAREPAPRTPRALQNARILRACESSLRTCARGGRETGSRWHRRRSLGPRPGAGSGQGDPPTHRCIRRHNRHSPPRLRAADCSHECGVLRFVMLCHIAHRGVESQLFKLSPQGTPFAATGISLHAKQAVSLAREVGK